MNGGHELHISDELWERIEYAAEEAGQDPERWIQDQIELAMTLFVEWDDMEEEGYE